MNSVLFGILFLTSLMLALAMIVVLARRIFVPDHAATLTVNEQKIIAMRTGQKLLTALQDNGLLIPSACAGAGTCGLCRVKVTQGAPNSLPIEAALFTRAERRAGVHLACQVIVREDMWVEVEADQMSAKEFVLPVVSTRHLTPLIRELVLQMPQGHCMDHVAGSFLQVTAPPFTLSYSNLEVADKFETEWLPFRPLFVASDADVTRAYSMSNRPEDTASGRVVLTIRLALPPPSSPGAPPGTVSSWLFSLKPKDTVRLSGPYGSFRVQPSAREMVFIGGGVGMAPLRAMIFEQLERVCTDRKMSFWYGARRASDLFYVDEFDRLAAQYENFNWTVALSDPHPDDDWHGAKGFVHQVALDRYLATHPAPESCEYYLCGPPLMIRAVLAMLDDLGVENDSIFNDDFGV